MTSLKFILRSLSFFKYKHLSLFAGTLLATAVLTGALIIGDSVKYSLKQLTETRLGTIRYTFSTGGRFVRSEIAQELSTALKAPSSAILMLQGIAVNQETQQKISRVHVVGVDSSFWQFADEILTCPLESEAIISQNTADQLNLKTGDDLLLKVDKAGLIPLNAPFSPESRPSVAFRLKISGIAGDKNLGRFSLKSNQIAPFTIFLNREELSRKLELVGLCNSVLFGNSTETALTVELLSDSVSKLWKPIDAGLKWQALPGKPGFEIVSNRVFIDAPISKEIQNLESQKSLVLSYLVNSIRTESDTTPYSFVTAMPASMLPDTLGDHEIIINEWLASDLKLKKGEQISLDYFVIGPLRKLIEKTDSFTVTAIIPNQGSYSDPSLMPDFPGLSEAGSCRDWNTGVPIDLKRIRDKDEEYWNQYKGTPKALISLSAGQNLWKNPFGDCTAVRFSEKSENPDSVMNLILHSLRPEQLGMRVYSVYSEGLFSAGNAVNFAELFLGLSFFIIASGILLIVLIFSLNAASRSTETALLSGLGLSTSLILRIRILESFVVVFFGSVFGAIAGIFYNYFLVYALNTVWQGAVQTNMLQVDIQIQSLAMGAGIGFVLAFLTIILVSRKNLKMQIAGLIKGNDQFSEAVKKRNSNWNKSLAIVALLVSIALLVYSLVSGLNEDPVLFLSAGAMFLIAAVSGISWFLDKSQNSANQADLRILPLAIKNAGRRKKRSLSLVMLISIGVYSIILTGSYRKTYSGTENSKESGTGAYAFWTETSIPIPADLNDPKMQKKFLLADSSELTQTHFEQFHKLDGDDASCLNLNQVLRPGILGIRTNVFDEREAFSFVSLHNDALKSHPWLGLKEELGANIIPAFADQSVIQYGLKKTIGDSLVYLNEKGETIYLVLIGGLENSVFQGNLLIDDSLFLHHFPSSGGSSVMLIETPVATEASIGEIMNNSFADYGIELSKASLRLANFNTVENTYLSVFMILGGLGLLIASIGMAIVLYRNILERKHEFAVLRAMGIRDSTILQLIISENFFLFFSGMGSGIFAAVISIIPSLFSQNYNTQIYPLAIIILLLVLVGFIGIWFPAKQSLKARLFEGLRQVE